LIPEKAATLAALTATLRESALESDAMGRLRQKSSFVRNPDLTIAVILTQGITTSIDEIDSYILDHKWKAIFDPKYGNGGSYKVARNSYTVDNKRSTIYLHRIILSHVLGRELSSYEEVDHIDLNTLNNCRSNLRLATHSQNSSNQRKRSDNSSGFKGVYLKNKKWCAEIRINGKKKHLGYFETPELAYNAYCKISMKLRGIFARLE